MSSFALTAKQWLCLMRVGYQARSFVLACLRGPSSRAAFWQGVRHHSLDRAASRAQHISFVPQTDDMAFSRVKREVYPAAGFRTAQYSCG